MRRLRVQLFAAMLMAFSPPTSTVAETLPAATDEKITVPLSTIWAYKMPGTLNIFDLEPEQKQLQSLPALKQRELLARRLCIPLVLSICADTSPHWPNGGEAARSGFVVEGIGREALEAAYRVLVEGEKPSDEVSSESEVSIVFFAYQGGAYVELKGVRREGNVVTLEYRFVSPQSMTQAAHVALIPLGKLTSGQYRVKLNQLPSGRELTEGVYGDSEPDNSDKALQAGWGRRRISGPFTFNVVSPKSATIEK